MWTMMNGGFTVTMLGILLLVLAVCLVLREFWCWFWKINRIVSLLEEIRDRLWSPTPKLCFAKRSIGGGT